MKRLLMATVVGLALSGCGTYETRGTRVSVDTQTGEAAVLESSYRLANRLKVTRVTYDESAGLRRATIMLTSQTKWRQRLQARMVWLDAEGVEIDADAKPFRAIVLDGNDTATFTGVAPHAKAVKVKLLVREMDTVE